MAQSNVCTFGARGTKGQRKEESQEREAAHGLIRLTGRDDKDVDGGQVGIPSQAHLGIGTSGAVGEGTPQRSGGYE